MIYYFKMAANKLVHLGISVVCDCWIHERSKINEKETFIAIQRESNNGLHQNGTPVPKHVGVIMHCIWLDVIVF
jgi:hypothetical protein